MLLKKKGGVAKVVNYTGVRVVVSPPLAQNSRQDLTDAESRLIPVKKILYRVVESRPFLLQKAQFPLCYPNFRSRLNENIDIRKTK